MEVYYVQKPFALVGDIYAPIQNVATLEASAVVSEGVSRVRNALINGDFLSYDWDSGRNLIQQINLIQKNKNFN